MMARFNTVVVFPEPPLRQATAMTVALVLSVVNFAILISNSFLRESSFLASRLLVASLPEYLREENN